MGHQDHFGRAGGVEDFCDRIRNSEALFGRCRLTTKDAVRVCADIGPALTSNVAFVVDSKEVGVAIGQGRKRQYLVQGGLSFSTVAIQAVVEVFALSQACFFRHQAGHASPAAGIPAHSVKKEHREGKLGIVQVDLSIQAACIRECEDKEAQRKNTTHRSNLGFWRLTSMPSPVRFRNCAHGVCEIGRCGQ